LYKVEFLEALCIDKGKPPLDGEWPGDFFYSQTIGLFALAFSFIDGLKLTNVLLKLSTVGTTYPDG
jgi:hypothetical protein